MEIIEIHAVPLSLRHVDDSRRLSRNSLHEMIFKKRKEKKKTFRTKCFVRFELETRWRKNNRMLQQSWNKRVKKIG